MTHRTLRIATRKSPLAMQQAQFIKESLSKHHPELDIMLIPMETTGDKISGKRLASFGGKGLFVKELEQALLNHQADLAVHSMKDVPTVQPEGLEISTICEREDPRDVLISIKYNNMASLPSGASIGTSSLRRQCQLRALRSDLKIKTLRGNVNTRLNHLSEGRYDAIVLAAAGIKRLHLEHHIREYFSVQHLLPAAGQAALGIECRREDIELKTLLQVLSDPVTQACLEAERALTHQLGGNCQTPIAAFCEVSEGQLSLRGLVGTPEGDIILHCHEKGNIEDPETLGTHAGQALLKQGAGEILKSFVNDSSFHE